MCAVGGGAQARSGSGGGVVSSCIVAQLESTSGLSQRPWV